MHRDQETESGAWRAGGQRWGGRLGDEQAGSQLLHTKVSACDDTCPRVIMFSCTKLHMFTGQRLRDACKAS